MGLHDCQIDWMRKHKYYSAYTIHGVAAGVGMETAGVDPLEITSVGMAAWEMVTDGDLLNGYIMCPYDLDPKFPVGFKVHWTAIPDDVGALTVDWILLQGTNKKGAAIAVPTAALDVVITTTLGFVDAAGAATLVDSSSQYTNRAVRTTLGLTRDDIEKHALITFSLEQDAAVNATSIQFMGIVMDYVPHKTEGYGCEIDMAITHKGR